MIEPLNNIIMIFLIVGSIVGIIIWGIVWFKNVRNGVKESVEDVQFLPSTLEMTNGIVRTRKGVEFRYKLNGKLHRKDGPAVIKADGTKKWYLNGIEVTEEEVMG